jgi:hypothetical protein
MNEIQRRSEHARGLIRERMAERPSPDESERRRRDLAELRQDIAASSRRFRERMRVHGIVYVELPRPDVAREAAAGGRSGVRHPPCDALFADRLDYVSRMMDGDAELARLLDIDPRQLERLRAGMIVHPEIRDRILGLDAVLSLLSGYLQPGSARRWLVHTNAHLHGRRPIRLLQEGHASAVIAVIEAEKVGSIT